MDKYMSKRWTVVFAGFLLALMGGLSYAWGIFVLPLVEKFGWNISEATLPFTVFMAVFAIVMVPAGRFQDRAGPKKTSFIGAILFFVAYGLSAFVYHFTDHWWLVMTYGVIGGIACALTYASIAPPIRKWYPDKPGLAISFGVMGFGLAALVFAPFKAKYLIPVHGIEMTFLLLAILTSSVSLFAAYLIKDPPEGWVPKGWDPSKKAKKTIRIREELPPKEVIRTPLFWDMWVIFALVVVGGLMSVGLIPSYGKIVVNLTPTKAAIAMSIFSAVNGFGRPLAGFLADKYGILKVMIVTYFIQTITLLLFPLFAKTMSSLYIASAFLGWGLAVTLALFPTLTSISFGIKHLGVNYGLIFTAFGVGAITSSVGSWIVDVTKSYTLAFVFGGILAGIAFILCIFLKKKHELP